MIGVHDTGVAAKTRERGRHSVEHLAAVVLRTGFAVSAVVIGLGLILQGSIGAQVRPKAGVITAAAGYPHGIVAVGRALAHGSGAAVLEVGLAVLVVTPIAAVVVAAIAYRDRGERHLALIGAALVAILALTFVAGLAGI